MPPSDPATSNHYARLIEGMLTSSPATFEPVAEDETAVQVERGVVLPMVTAGADAAAIGPIVERLQNAETAKLRVVDAAGHARPGYPGLLVYAWRRAIELLERRTDSGEGPELFVTQEWHWRLLASFQRSPGAEMSDAFVGVLDGAWSALAAGHEATWVFSEIVNAQQSSGALVPANASESPETYWYRELVLLHALTAHAARTADPTARDAAARAAAFHLNETQPDHATNEPWGLLAFIRNRDANSVADQMLHTVRVQHPAGPQGVTRILLADVLDGLRAGGEFRT